MEEILNEFNFLTADYDQDQLDKDMDKILEARVTFEKDISHNRSPLGRKPIDFAEEPIKE